MTTTVDSLTSGERDVVFGTPALAADAVMRADPGGRRRERHVVPSAWFAAATANLPAAGLLPEADMVVGMIDERSRDGRTPGAVLDEAVASCRTARSILVERADPDEADGYSRFVVAFAEGIASASGSGPFGFRGEPESPAEAAAIDALRSALM